MSKSAKSKWSPWGAVFADEGGRYEPFSAVKILRALPVPIKGQQVLVAQALLGVVKPDTSYGWVSLRQLADKSCTSMATVATTLARLKQNGLEVKRPGAAHLHQANVYDFTRLWGELEVARARVIRDEQAEKARKSGSLEGVVL